MPFSETTQDEIKTYIFNHLPDESWYDNYFDFIKDPKLSKRLSEEFISTRCLYKFLEGIQADKWLRNAQIRLQIISYASIYEAVIHHILFDLLIYNTEVQKLLDARTFKRISVSKALDTLTHCGKKIITVYEDTTKKEIRQIRFEEKADLMMNLGFINSSLCTELKQLYALRNAIHLVAEIDKNVSYHLRMSTIAYRRMQPFREQMMIGIAKNGLI
jgi:hypothetical protein